MKTQVTALLLLAALLTITTHAFSVTPRINIRRQELTLPRLRVAGEKGSLRLFMTSADIQRQEKRDDEKKDDPRRHQNKNILFAIANLANRKAKIFVLKISLLFLQFSNKITEKRVAVIEKLQKRPPTTINKLAILLVSRLMTIRFWVNAGMFFLALKFFGALPGNKGKNKVTEIAYSTFLRLVSQYPEKIKQVRVTPNEILFHFDGLRALTRTVPMETSLMNKLLDSGIEFYSPPSQKNTMVKYTVDLNSLRTQNIS
jgi:hypothetical protein